jgi:hypothetical protein
MPEAIGSFFNENNVADGGSDYGYWRTVEDTEGTTTDSWSDMPVREKYDMPNNSSTNTKTSEGNIERTTSTKKKFDLQLIFQQFDDEIYTTIVDNIEGEIVQILLERNQVPINGYKHYLLTMGKVTKVPTPGAAKSPEFEFSLLGSTKSTDISVTVNSTLFPLFTNLGTVGSAILQKPGKYFGLGKVAYIA